MLVNFNFLFNYFDIFFILSLFTIFILLKKTTTTSNQSKNDNFKNRENNSDNSDDSKKIHESSDTNKSKKQKAYIDYIKNYINQNKNYYNIKFNLDYYLLKKKKYRNNHFNFLFDYIIDFTASRMYAYKSKARPYNSFIRTTTAEYTVNKLIKGSESYVNFLKLLNKKNNNFIFTNLKNNNYSNNIFIYQLIKKINFKPTYNSITSTIYSRLLGLYLDEFELTHPLTRFKVNFKFLKPLMNSVFKGKDPSQGYLYRLFNYSYYKNHLFPYLRKIYYRVKSQRYVIKHSLDFFRVLKIELTSSYKVLNQYMFKSLLNAHQSNFPFLPIEGTKLFSSEFKRSLGAGNLKRLFVDFLDTSNFLNFEERHDYEDPDYSGQDSYYNRLYKYFTNYRTMLFGQKIIETQIFLFLTKYFPSTEIMLILKNQMFFISQKDYLFGLTRYTFPHFHDFKFYLPFPVSELANMLGLNEIKTPKDSFYSFYYNLKSGINLFDYLNMDLTNLNKFHSSKFLVTDQQFMNFKLHRNYLFRQLLGSFSIAMRKLEFDQFKSTKYSLALTNIFQFLYGKNSDDSLNITSSTSNIGNYEASPAFIQLRNISFSLSYRRSGFLNKLSRIPKRYERHLSRQIAHNYIRYFYKPRRNIHKIFLKLNSSPMRFKINFYDLFKEVFNLKYNIILIEKINKFLTLVSFSIQNYLQFYINSVSFLKTSSNFKFILFPEVLKYSLINTIQKKINSIFNILSIFLFNLIFIKLDNNINITKILGNFNFYNFFLIKYYTMLIIHSAHRVKKNGFSFGYLCNFALFSFDRLVFVLAYENIKNFLNIVFFLLPIKINIYMDYLCCFFQIGMNYFIKVIHILFIFILHNFYILKAINVMWILILSNVIIKSILNLINFALTFEFYFFVKKVIEYVLFYWVLDAEYYLDFFADRLIYLSLYQHIYWFSPGLKIFYYFTVWANFWYIEFVDPLYYWLLDLIQYYAIQYWKIYTKSIFHNILIFYKLDQIPFKLWKLITYTCDNPNFILKFIIGYIILLYYHISFSLILSFPIIYLIVVLFSFLFILIPLIKFYNLKKRDQYHMLYRYPFCYYNLLTLYIVRGLNYYINFILGFFFTYVRLAAEFILQVNTAYYLNHCRLQKYLKFKKKNLTYLIDLTKFK